MGINHKSSAMHRTRHSSAAVTLFRTLAFFGLLATVLPWSISPLVAAQTRVTELNAELAAGGVRLSSMRGNGNSSGSAIEGVLTNLTGRQKNISIHLSRPIYLRNENRSGQNMVATEVLLAGGRYYTEGSKSFITLENEASESVLLVAYCTDFEKENPSRGDGFSVGTLPSILEEVASRIEQHAREYPEEDITIAAQVAIWLAQGVSAEDIAAVFSFSPSDERLARKLVR